MAIDETLGLRDRKRLETRARLEEAAVALVLRDGLEHTTVDAISELAHVSSRTFFNYFDNKDSAIMGLRPPEARDRAVAEHLADYAGDGSVDSVVHLIYAVTGTPLTASSIREDRMEIVRRYPQLLADQLTQMTQFTGRLTEAVQTVLAADLRFSTLPPAQQAARAELVLALCSTAVRVCVREWVADDGAADQSELEHRTTHLVHDLVERLR